MTWSEKAIEAALKHLSIHNFNGEDGYSSPRDAMRAALDAAQAVYGDAKWNAAIEAAARTVEAHLCLPWFIDENGMGCRDNASAKAGNENIARLAAAIRSLKKDKP